MILHFVQPHLEEDKTFVLLDDEEENEETDEKDIDDFTDDEPKPDVEDITG